MDIDSAGDYYALFGVDVEVDTGELQRAWRQVALRWHPDRAGPGATATFQRLLDAYTVLSDPVARAAYDRRRGGPSKAASAAPARSAPAVMLGRLSGSLNALLACGVARRAEDGVIELLLSAEEAGVGGMVTISMRVPVFCPACAANAEAACAGCGGRRTVEDLFSAWLAVRPGVADGAVLTPSALLPGMVQPVSFRVRLRGAT